MFLRSGAVGASVGSASEPVRSDSFLYRPPLVCPQLSDPSTAPVRRGTAGRSDLIGARPSNPVAVSSPPGGSALHLT